MTKAKGRGAITNPTGRYERFTRVPLDDGWEPEERQPAAVETIVRPETTKTLITRNDSPDVPFDRSINPYKGCEHGCIYCFARPTHAYLGLSPGLDFETRIFSKSDAAERLRAELARPRYRCEVLALGANTDPYQPVERRLGITRSILKVLAEHQHPVSIVTKSHLVLRDLDLLRPMAERCLASVLVSVTTLDRSLARRLEPRAPTPERRLQAIRCLHEAGIPVGVLASPMIPAINDQELEAILERCAAAGASSAGYILVRLPLELKELFREWLETHYPTRAQHVLSLIKETRSGALYDARFGARMRGTGPYAAMIENRFRVACRRWKLEKRPDLDTTRFRRPPRRGEQGSLF